MIKENSKNINPKKIRAKHSKDTEFVKIVRWQFYARAFSRINEAIKKKFYLEAITLEESIMSDRLESRLDVVKAEKPQEYKTLGKLIGAMKDKNINTLNQEQFQLLEEVNEWYSNGRCLLLHEMVKFNSLYENMHWQERYDSAKEVAIKGKQLAQALSDLVKKLNKQEIEKK